MDENFAIVGHRGARRYCIENTIECFKKALDCGATSIEFDLRETKDGEIIVIHDPSVDRVFGVRGEVKNMCLRELKELDKDGAKIPTLEEVLDAFRDKLAFDIEIKVEGIEEKVLRIIKDKECEEKVMITSFLPSVLITINKINKDIKLGILFSALDKKIWSLTEKIGAYALVPHYKIVSPDFISMSHRNNLKVFPWTVNEKTDMIKLLEIGIDGLITDDPCLFSKILHDVS